MGKIWKVGVIGCGNISDIYVSNIQTYFKNLEIVACAARHIENAQKMAEKYGIEKAVSVDELLADESIEMVLNLTVPKAHYEINKKALLSGKHVYCEKPFAGSMEEIEELVKLAGEKNLRVGCAPDTWLGTSLQTCKHMIESGKLGQIISVTVNLCHHGVETWHPSPYFYYENGGGPVLDMGPYYFTALVNLLGPIESVYALSSMPMTQRPALCNPNMGEMIPVEIDTSYCGMMKFKSGAIGTMQMSFDIWQSDLPMFEIHGTKGVMSVPDPNWFDGEIKLLLQDERIDQLAQMDKEQRIETIPQIQEWFTVSEADKIYTSPTNNMRGLGLWDMADSIEKGKLHQTHPDLILHVMEVLFKLNEGERNKEPQIHHSFTPGEVMIPEVLK